MAPSTRTHALQRTRRLATGLLVVMSLLFVASFHLGSTPVAPWLRAFSEAAMVGALADWFAVVALFRRPLGLPFPHSAILPRSKARVASGLAEFVQSNFLSDEVIAGKLRSFGPAERIAAWCADPARRRELASVTIGGLRSTLTALDDRSISTIAGQLTEELARSVPLSTTAGILLTSALSDGDKSALLEQAISFADYLLAEHSTFLEQMLDQHMPWYVPSFVHDVVYQRIIEQLRRQIAEILADPLHPTRALIRIEGLRLAERWRSSPEAARNGERIKSALLDNEGFRQFFLTAGGEIKKILIETLTKPDSGMVRAVERFIQQLGEILLKEEALRTQLDNFITEMVSRLVKNHSAELRSLVADTVDRWDAATIAEKIEREVGRDLQYVRINGTIVGGTVGILLHAATLWLGY